MAVTTRIIALTVVALVACGPPAARTQTAQLPTATLDQLLAPIALYPDQLLAQMLISAAEPAKITELDKWLKSNEKLKGTQLQDAAVKAGFDASFVALVVFPQVVARMAEQIAWTTVLGQSFTADRTAVFASIQKLRAQAKSVGSLKSTPQQEVETKKTSSGEEVIVIEPTNPQIVYVPQYNTQVVYTQAPTTVVIQEDDDDAEEAIAAGLIGFTAGIAIGAAMDNNYYYGPCCMYRGAYMYNDAWDDYYDHREDAREDWMDHREDIVEDRGDRRENTQEQRTDRQENRQENRPESQGQRAQAAQAQGTQAQRTERSTQAQGAATQRATTQGATAQTRTGSPEARGYSTGTQSPAVQQRSGSSDAFSGYSNGQSQRASSTRGQQSRGSSSRSRGGSGGGGGGGRRR